MANKLVTQFKSLPKWGQGAIVVGGVAIAYLLYKRFLAQPLFSDRKPKRLRTEKDIENQGNTIHYTPNPYALDYNDLAKKIYDAMNGLGTYVWDITSVIKEMRNQADWNALQKAYGTRKLKSGYWGKDFTGNLKDSLYDELSTSEMKNLVDALAEKGISY
jgi:hypothetical protein